MSALRIFHGRRTTDLALAAERARSADLARQLREAERKLRQRGREINALKGTVRAGVAEKLVLVDQVAELRAQLAGAEARSDR